VPFFRVATAPWGGAQDVAEDVLGAAKERSDLAHDVAVDVLGAAKNGGLKVLIVKVLSCPSPRQEPGMLYHSPDYPSLPGNAKRLYVHPRPCPSGGPSRRA